MKPSEIIKIGHWPTVAASFFYLTSSFMAWVSLGPLIIYISEGMNITTEGRFRLLAAPILVGSLLRVPVGVLADRVGAKITGTMGQLVTIVSIGFACVFGLSTPTQLLIFACSLGIAGTAFSVAIPQASRWYPARYQGLVMGIVGSGNMGVALTSFYAPWVSGKYGWQSACGLLLAFLLLTLIFYLVAARDVQGVQSKQKLANLAELVLFPDSLWLMLFYFITFGGFVGLASILPLLLNTQYHTTGVISGLVSAAIILLGSLARPVGGYAADRFGGASTLFALFGLISAAYFLAASLTGLDTRSDQSLSTASALSDPAALSVAIFSVATVCLGMGNGAVFQLIGQRFRNEIGAMTGMVGAAGGLGGFFLAQALAFSEEVTGGFRFGFALLGLLALLGFVSVHLTKVRWCAVVD
jgi:NNP family nitrate/nitrite transporter-like MFS transporter